MSAPAGRPLRADAARNRAAVVAAARDAFASKGVEASLEEIARAAGVGPGTLYRHFPARADLVAAAVAEHVAELRADAVRLGAATDPAAALVEWIHLLAAYSGTYGGLPNSVLAASAADGPLARICQDLEGLTGELVVRAQASGRVRAEVSGEDVFVLANALAWADSHDLEHARSTDRIAILVRGILT
ncbi:TetR/AcrR family transcriptional regulator [Nocardia sp. CNY236]|uniref:TetR/AcrR family transcriptional regulator n=1 Tax=Nocardia sp. CNY236 TaxID=1169152 RepID=UPI000428B630|nr:TetR/AcrR family transcriptional regulator [Nocardia sp. CNY236]